METDLLALGVIAKMPTSFLSFGKYTLQLNWDFQATAAYLYIHTAFIHNFGSPN